MFLGDLPANKGVLSLTKRNPKEILSLNLIPIHTHKHKKKNSTSVHANKSSIRDAWVPIETARSLDHPVPRQNPLFYAEVDLKSFYDRGYEVVFPYCMRVRIFS